MPCRRSKQSELRFPWRLSPLALLAIVSAFPLPSSALTAGPRTLKPTTSSRLHRPSSLLKSSQEDADTTITTTPVTNQRIFFDIAIPNKTEQIPLGRLTFRLTPPTLPNSLSIPPEPNPAHLPLHTENLLNLALGTRRSIDPKSTYVGCQFAYSPAFIQDGSFRYRWSHECDGFGRNAIRAAKPNTGELTGWDESFSDPERLLDCSHKCFGGVYYGMKYEDVIAELEELSNAYYSECEDDEVGQELEVQAVLLTVPIHGPKSGTSKFSIVRVGESPREWGERLLLNSAVVGYLDCWTDGRMIDEEEDGEEGERVNPLDVLRAMAQQRIGPPTIIDCGVIE